MLLSAYYVWTVSCIQRMIPFCIYANWNLFFYQKGTFPIFLCLWSIRSRNKWQSSAEGGCCRYFAVSERGPAISSRQAPLRGRYSSTNVTVICVCTSTGNPFNRVG